MSKASTVSNTTSTMSNFGDAAGTILSIRASAANTIAAQDEMARIQNDIALNLAKNQVIEELGKGVKQLAQG